MEFSFKMLDSLTFDFSLGGSGGSPAPEPMPAVFRNHALGSASLRIADPPLFHASAEEVES